MLAYLNRLLKMEGKASVSFVRNSGTKIRPNFTVPKTELDLRRTSKILSATRRDNSKISMWLVRINKIDASCAD